MNMIVNSTNFRSNYSTFIDQLLAQGGVIKIKRGKNIVARVTPEIVLKNKDDNWGIFWNDMKKIWAKQKVTSKKTNYSMKVDEILYGAQN